MSVHSLIALPLPEAEELLRREGIPLLEVTETAPPGQGPKAESRDRPRRPALAGGKRVVRERRSEKGVHLTVAEAVSGPERRSAER